MSKKYLLIKTFDDETKVILNDYKNEHIAIANAQEEREFNKSGWTVDIEVIEIDLDSLETKLVWNVEMEDRKNEHKPWKTKYAGVDTNE